MNPPMRRHFLYFVLATLLIAGRASGQTNYYWNGGSGNWDTTSNLWRSPTSSDGLGPWVNSSSSVAQIGDLGSGGTLTITTSITASAVNVNSSGFTLQPNATQTVTGNISLATGVTLNLNEAGTTSDRTLNISGNVSGGSGITIQGGQTSSRASRVNLSTNNTTVSTAVTINLTNTGVGGLVSTATGVQITGTITNNSSGST